MRLQVIALLLALAVPASAVAQAVVVRVSSRAIADDDDLQVTFTFKGAGENQVPNLRNDWTIAGQNSGTSTQWVNGQVFNERTVTMVLRPKRTGQLRVGAARLVARDGTIIATSTPLTIQVRGIAAMRPSEARQQRNLTQDVVFLVPEFARDVYYVGEPFVVQWILYVQSGKRIRQPDISEMDVPDAVQREDVLNGRLSEEGQPRQFFGRKYARVPVLREVWKVLRPETVTVPGLKVVVDLPGRGFGRGTRKRLKAPPLIVQVRPVPVNGRPRDYREGTIGQFAMTAEIQADEEHGRALLSVTVTGSGGLATIDPPTIKGITGAQVKSLPSDDKDRITTTDAGVSGSRSFQYLLTPERAGTVFVPAIALSYFDPEVGRFKTTKSQPQTWVAKKAVESTRRSAVAAAGQSEDAELHPIEGESTLESVSTVPLHQRPWFVALLAIPLLAFLGLESHAGYLHWREKGSSKTRARRAHTTGNKRLRAAEALIKDAKSAEFFAELARVLRAYVEDKNGLVLTGMTNEQMRSALEGAGYDAVLADKLVAELENCDFARFAGAAGPSSDPQKSLGRGKEILAALEATHA